MNGVKVPVSLATIVANRKAELLGGSVDRVSLPFDFEEIPNGGFIEIKVKTAEVEGCSILFILKRRAKAQKLECPSPISRLPNSHFLLELLFIAR